MRRRNELIVAELLARHGRLYAEDAGIRLADRPGPLYQLLVLATLLSAPIPAEPRWRRPASCSRPVTGARRR